jgi:hypothetical protein
VVGEVLAKKEVYGDGTMCRTQVLMLVRFQEGRENINDENQQFSKLN